METEDLTYMDIVSQLALINMLKVNLSCCPDIYRTLLAVLCDYDPNKPESKRKTSQYIRLLISDKLLADCIIASLPDPDEDQESLDVEVNNEEPPFKNRTSSSSSWQTERWEDGDNNKESVSSEGTSKSITIIVSEQRDSPNHQDETKERKLTIPGVPRPVTMYPMGKDTNISQTMRNSIPVLDRHQHKERQKTTSRTSSTDSMDSPASKASHNNSNSVRTPVSILKPKTDGQKIEKIAASLSSSISQLTSTSSTSGEYKQRVIKPKPKLVLPIKVFPSVQNVSSISMNMPDVSQTATFGQQQNTGNSYNVQQSQQFTTTTNMPNASSGSYNSLVQVLPKPCTTIAAKRYASTSVDVEPILKMRKLSQSIDGQTQVSNKNLQSDMRVSNQLHGAQDTPLIDISNFPNSSKAGNTCNLIGLQQNSSVRYDGASSLPIHSNQATSNPGLTINPNISQSMQSSGADSENKTIKQLLSESSKKSVQHSLLTPTKVAKEYHLPNPMKKTTNPEITHNSSSVQQELVSEQPSLVSISAVPIPSFEETASTSNLDKLQQNAGNSSSVCNSISYGSSGPKSFPYRQQIHLSNGSSTILDFQSDYSEILPSVSNEEKYQVKAEYTDMALDNLPVDMTAKETNFEISNDPNFKTLGPNPATHVPANSATMTTDTQSCSGSFLNTPWNMAQRKYYYTGNLGSESSKFDSTSSTSSIPNNDNTKEKDTNNSAKQTFLIIETKTSTGSDQVQIKLNPQTSGNLLGELFKLKPGLAWKQSCKEPKNSGDYKTCTSGMEPATENSTDIGVPDETEQEMDNVFESVEDNPSLSDISDADCSDSEKYNCSDDICSDDVEQYENEFSEDSDMLPIKLDNYPGQPKLVSFPILRPEDFPQGLQPPLVNTDFPQVMQQQQPTAGISDQVEAHAQTLDTPKVGYCEPYQFVNDSIYPTTEASGMPAELTEPNNVMTMTNQTRIDNMDNVVQTSISSRNPFRYLSYGVSPYLLGLVPDINSASYDDNISIEESDDVFLNEYITPNLPVVSDTRLNNIDSRPKLPDEK